MLDTIERLSRRRFLGAAAAGAASLALSACTSSIPRRETIGAVSPVPAQPNYDLAYYQDLYSARVDEGYELPAIPVERIDPAYLRQMVPDPTGEAPGTIVVDQSQHYLYFVQPGGQAMRYGVGLGREGFAWSGRAVVQWKRKWPRWTPPDEMVARQPELEPYSIENGGMEPGLDNPLGARALYIFQDGEDTLYRLHGSPEWWSIGQSVSSGCVRLINQDVIDLYDRVPNGSPILVVPSLGVA
ncbi:MAG: L,D-transpeptidase [Rhizobiaceae bacterium]|nr:L,D-transpeptidase [Rhizobiaceae bacterium]